MRFLRGGANGATLQPNHITNNRCRNIISIHLSVTFFYALIANEIFHFTAVYHDEPCCDVKNMFVSLVLFLLLPLTICIYRHICIINYRDHRTVSIRSGHDSTNRIVRWHIRIRQQTYIYTHTKHAHTNDIYLRIAWRATAVPFPIYRSITASVRDQSGVHSRDDDKRLLFFFALSSRD